MERLHLRSEPDLNGAQITEWGNGSDPHESGLPFDAQIAGLKEQLDSFGVSSNRPGRDLVVLAVLAVMADELAALRKEVNARHLFKHQPQKVENVQSSPLASTAQKGDKGDKGEKGDPGAPPEHEWKDTRLRFKRPDGKWGKFVDLRGHAGPPGPTGRSGGGGFGRITVNPFDSLPSGDSSEPSGLIVSQGGVFKHLSWSAFIEMLGAANGEGAVRVDFVGSSIYRGEAEAGASEDAPLWRIRRIVISESDGDVSTTWAVGTTDYVHAWSQRSTLEYF